MEVIGRDLLLSAPAPRVGELADGSILVASYHPESDWVKALDDVATHLGIPTWAEYTERRSV
ncbi:hypothetical protein BRD17_02285 [Halobacteriales archaeon SW_7_68_16]|nr:MAG: hypothetical protein BRD17_02285 [Halobacteriales archaeon SW_7_68_16]